MYYYKYQKYKSKYLAQKHKNTQKVRVELRPFFVYDGNEYDTTIYLGHAELDKLVKQRIKNDYTNIKSILDYEYKVNNYKFDGNKIFLDLSKKKGAFTEKDFENIQDTVDPYNTGPDTWMEGNIVILTESETKKLPKNHPYHGKSLELAVEVADIKRFK